MDSCSTEFLDLISKICCRAEKMKIGVGSGSTQFMDMEMAARKFNMDLESWLIAEPFDFAHDYIGIQNSIERQTYNHKTDMCEFSGFFLPRFSKRTIKTESEDM